MTLVYLWGFNHPLSAKSKFYGNVDLVLFHECYDGDTCTVSIPDWPSIVGDHISIRLNGIDAPEIKGKCAQERQLAQKAKAFVNNTLRYADKIELRNLQRGKYFRLVADVWVDGHSLNEQILNENMAVAYDGKTKTHNWCDVSVAKSETLDFEIIERILTKFWEWLKGQLLKWAKS